MAHTEREHVLIVGAGLAGALLACLLSDRGYRVTIAERRPDPRAKGFIGGRSINLALSVRGITALESAGMAEKVLSDAIAMPGRMLHDELGTLTFQPYSSDPGDHINSVSRGGLNLTLLEAADRHDHVTLQFDHRCLEVDLDGASATFDVKGHRSTISADVLVGADGAYSAVRDAFRVTDRFDYSQEYLDHGYKELHIPPAAECGVDPSAHDGFAMEPNALHIWPRGGSMMIALPNPDRSFTCTLFWPYRGEHSFADLPDGASDGDIRAFFERHYLDSVPLMPTLVEDFRTNPTSSLVTVRCRPWQRNGKAVLIGDASHAIVPFFGQGMNAGFEDCRVLIEMLDERDGDWAGVLPEFAERRKPDADAIADMALDNFVEMRDRVADPEFLYRKRVEQALHAAYPDRAVPKYNLVSFSNVPYAEALERGNRLAAVVRAVSERITLEHSYGMADERWQADVVDAARPMIEELPKADA